MHMGPPDMRGPHDMRPPPMVEPRGMMGEPRGPMMDQRGPPMEPRGSTYQRVAATCRSGVAKLSVCRPHAEKYKLPRANAKLSVHPVTIERATVFWN